MHYKAKAYAKLNLFLDVLGKRPDGYHDIDSVMQSISLYDNIEISLRSDNEVNLSYQDECFSREDDILYRAYKLFSDYSGWNGGVDIYVEKNIPTYAGLGGFSADIAALLKLLNKISDKNYPDETMLSLCKKLGADVPFCYNGGTARTRGIGEELEMLSTPEIYLVLLKEGDKRSTGEMYNILDSLALMPSDKIEAMLLGIESNNNALVLNSVYNIFENCWSFEKMKAWFEGFSADAVFLSGSGPTTVAAFSNGGLAKECYNKLSDIGKNVFFAETVATGNVIE